MVSELSGPQSRPIDALQAAVNIFNLDTLEHSFELLRHGHPTLALIIQNHTAEYHRQAISPNQELWISLDLSVETVSEIVSALSAIAEEAAKNPLETKEHRVAIHQNLLEWLMYAQSFLGEE